MNQVTIEALKKINTNRLAAIYTEITGREPSEMIDRQMMINIVYCRQHEAEVEENADRNRQKGSMVVRSFHRINKSDKNDGKSRFSDRQIKMIREMKKAGASYGDIRKVFGMELRPNYLRNIVIGKIYKYI